MRKIRSQVPFFATQRLILGRFTFGHRASSSLGNGVQKWVSTKSLIAFLLFLVAKYLKTDAVGTQTSREETTPVTLARLVMYRSEQYQREGATVNKQ